jgi:UDP-N-acetylmuramoyl-L-alanyl-D-glutamate--2,6-diaminopimelate ligase
VTALVAATSRTISELAGAVPARRLLRVVGDGTVTVTDLTHDSRQVRPGTMFACLVGADHDGHDFAPAAVATGAPALLVERILDVDAVQVVVDDTRATVGHVAAAVHGRPSTRVRMVGVTGTNGKTTTAHLIGAILDGAGMRTAVLGTLTGVRTTPEAADLQRDLAALADAGTTAVVMEVSSHALALHRVTGTRFDAAVFTNLGRDHLDLHGSMEGYFRAKAQLFTAAYTDIGIVNADDPYGRLLLDSAAIDDAGVEMVPYGRSDATGVVATTTMHSFSWRGRRVEVGIGGAFNVMNSIAALTATSVLGLDDATAVRALGAAPPVPGRFEVVAAPPGAALPTVVVDYAHTPDGLVELLTAARQAAGSGRVIVVFGCGGDRDRDKRPQMGAAAVAGADRVVVTSDNPRGEDPGAIIDAVLRGIPTADRDRVVVEADRREAISLALDAAGPRDLVVVAGKGHETTQDLGDRVVEFDDRVVAAGLMAARA